MTTMVSSRDLQLTIDFEKQCSGWNTSVLYIPQVLAIASVVLIALVYELESVKLP
jgi:hypothetical protein